MRVLAEGGQAAKPSGDKPVEKIAKIDGLILKLLAALDEGTAALAEAEAKREEIVGTAKQGQPEPSAQGE